MRIKAWFTVAAVASSAVFPIGLGRAAPAPENLGAAAELPKVPLERLSVFTEFENNASPQALAKLLRRREEITSSRAATGVTRYWAAAVCGYGVNRLFVSTEFVNLGAMTQAWQDLYAAPDMRQWDADARAAGLALKSRILMGNINPEAGAIPGPAPDGRAPAPPHVMQFIEMDVGGKVEEYKKLLARSAAVLVKHGGGGLTRVWGMGWAGERTNNLIVTREFKNFKDMSHSIEQVDGTDDFRQNLADAKAAGFKRVSECVTTEVYP